MLVAALPYIAQRVIEMPNDMEQITGDLVRNGSVIIVGDPIGPTSAPASRNRH